MSDNFDPGSPDADRQDQANEELIHQVVEQIAAADGAAYFFDCLTDKLYDPHQNICTVGSVTDEELLQTIQILESDCKGRHYLHVNNAIEKLKHMMEQGQATLVRWALARLVGKALAAG